MRRDLPLRGVLGTLAALGLAAGVRAQSAAAEALWTSGRRVEALEAMERELEARPDEIDLRRTLAEREMQVRRFAAALEHATPLGPELDPLRGRALYFLGRYEEALPKLDPLDGELLRLRIEALRALGRVEAMEALIPTAVERYGEDDAWVLLLRARRAERLGEEERAIELFRAASARDPLAAEARFGLGRALLRAGSREEGLQVLEAHRRLAPLLDALDFAQRGVELAPEHAANRAALGDAWRALAPFDPRALDRAEAEYQRAQRTAEGEALVAVALRRARLFTEDRGDARSALAVLDDALERFDDARLHVRAADVLAADGRRDEARAHLRAALALRPGDRAIEERLRGLDGAGGGG